MELHCLYNSLQFWRDSIYLSRRENGPLLLLEISREKEKKRQKNRETLEGRKAEKGWVNVLSRKVTMIGLLSRGRSSPRDNSHNKIIDTFTFIPPYYI